ncbi:MAG: hypothetical protein NUW01_02810 [Gemmatimonadaceae bacterium]|nr:hypothetical protein [Gemmatimonadaceae bacterium]
MTRRYVLGGLSRYSGCYVIKDARTGRLVALVWPRRLARRVRDCLNTGDMR